MIWPPASVYLAAFVSRFEKYLGEAQGVRIKGDRLRWQGHGQLMALTCRAAGAPPPSPESTTLFKRDVLLFEVELALRDAGDIEEIVQQPGHVFDLALNDGLRPLQLLGSQFRGAQHLGGVADGG